MIGFSDVLAREEHPTGKCPVAPETDPPNAFFRGTRMPDSGGFDILRELRRSPETRDLPELVFTIQTTDEHTTTGSGN